jgi:hypothetical protein
MQARNGEAWGESCLVVYERIRSHKLAPLPGDALALADAFVLILPSSPHQIRC